MGPRRVTILIDSLVMGGAERVAVEAAAALDPERFVPHLLVTRHSGPLEALVRDHGMECTILGRTRRYDPAALVRACSVAAATDLVHSHKFAGSLWGAAISMVTRRPLVAHEHTFDGVRTKGRTLGYRLVIGRRAAKIVCVSESIAQSLRDEGIPEHQIEVVRNGVPAGVALPREAARRELGLDPDATVIGSIARLRPEKRHDLALEAVARLHRRGKDVTLCVIGDGPLRADLRRRAAELGVAGCVVWSGERPEARRLVAAFDVAILCSEYEAMPLAALEALVAGVPLVATAVGGLPELVTEERGTIVPPDRPDALAEGIQRELAVGRQRHTEALEALGREFGLERMVAELQRIYGEALEAVRRPRRTPRRGAAPHV